ncbi:hypothetical protein [uncultured Desulfosarcina sp.]|uniref:hypothetical protein n=1 Tax=uncultured Desulfosarcina sp. TaxID=218289 RepID=UPI0029C81BFA|nr:hypothetical protein [uncultured Desulfosarcina sp.]
MMDWWWIIKLFWGGIGLGLACLLLIVVWRAQGFIAWNRSLQKELKSLTREAETVSVNRRNGIRVIQDRCDEIRYSLSPRLGDMDQLRDYVRAIAACFFPDTKFPELQVSLGYLVHCINDSLVRFDRILQRPELNRLKSMNIKTIRNLYRWSIGVMQHPSVKWYAEHRILIRRISRIRFLFFIDPFSWFFLLSRKIVVLLLIRTLVLDLTVYVGKVALNAYDQKHARAEEDDAGILEETLEDLSHLQMPPAMETDPALLEIRQELVGFSAVMLSKPTWEKWKEAVRKAANHIARKHFPNSDAPVEEAAIGPLLYRTRSWLETLGKGETIAIVRYAYRTRLETLFQARDVSDFILTPMVRHTIRTALDTYGWLKWPLLIYRRAKRFSLPLVAVDIGWFVGKKTILVLIHGRTFDQVCRELDWVYRISSR